MKNTLILFIVIGVTVSSFSQSGAVINLSLKKEEPKYHSASSNLNNIGAFSTQDKLSLKNELLTLPFKQDLKKFLMHFLLSIPSTSHN